MSSAYAGERVSSKGYRPGMERVWIPNPRPETEQDRAVAEAVRVLSATDQWVEATALARKVSMNCDQLRHRLTYHGAAESDSGQFLCIPQPTTPLYAPDGS